MTFDTRIGIEELPEPGRLESQFTIPRDTVLIYGNTIASDSPRARADRARALVENGRDAALVERVARRVVEIMRGDFSDEGPTIEHLPNRDAIQAKLDDQIAISHAAYGCDPPKLYLIPEEFTLWCATAHAFDSMTESYKNIQVVPLEGPR